MKFDLPRDVIFPVDEARIELDPAEHPFEKAHASAIDDNWTRELAAKPAMFDGRVALLSSLSHENRCLAGRCHIVRFATFLWWRRLRPHPDAGHVFAHAMPVSADNRLMAIRMGASTANAGAVYFAAGSFEPVDFIDGRADIASNMRREVLEETGLDLNDARVEPRLHALSTVSGTVLFQRFRFSQTADALARSISAFVSNDPEPEIEGPVTISKDARQIVGLAPHMPAIIDWHYGG